MFKRFLLRLLWGLIRKLIKEELKRAYEAGVGKGYELGYMLGKTERNNRGFIIGTRLNREIEEIIKEKGG